MKTNELIRAKRKEKGLTLKDVANLVGVNEGTVSRWESGDIQNMKRINIEKLSRVLDIPPSVLLDWDSYDEERIKRNELIRKLTLLANVAELEHLELAVDLLRRLSK